MLLTIDSNEKTFVFRVTLPQRHKSLLDGILVNPQANGDIMKELVRVYPNTLDIT
jgi:hypothetical protein